MDDDTTEEAPTGSEPNESTDEEAPDDSGDAEVHEGPEMFMAYTVFLDYGPEMIDELNLDVEGGKEIIIDLVSDDPYTGDVDVALGRENRLPIHLDFQAVHMVRADPDTEEPPSTWVVEAESPEEAEEAVSEEWSFDVHTTQMCSLAEALQRMVSDNGPIQLA